MNAECLKLMMERNPAPMWPLLPTASSMTTTSISTTPSITAITEDTPVPIERKSSQESSGTVVYCHEQHVHAVYQLQNRHIFFIVTAIVQVV